MLPQKPLLKVLDNLGKEIVFTRQRETEGNINKVRSKFALTETPSGTKEDTKNFDKDADVVRRNKKATKNNDAPVSEYLWDEAIVNDGSHTVIKALSIIRGFVLRW